MHADDAASGNKHVISEADPINQVKLPRYLAPYELINPNALNDAIPKYSEWAINS